MYFVNMRGLFSYRHSETFMQIHFFESLLGFAGFGFGN